MKSFHYQASFKAKDPMCFERANLAADFDMLLTFHPDSKDAKESKANIQKAIEIAKDMGWISDRSIANLLKCIEKAQDLRRDRDRCKSPDALRSYFQRQREISSKLQHYVEKLIRH